MTREEVKFETKLDPLLQKVVTTISLNNWTDPSVERYRRFPVTKFSSLQNRAIELANIGHQDIVKTKQLLSLVSIWS